MELFERIDEREFRGVTDTLADVGETVIASPHKVYGPEQNDLALQLRKRGPRYFGNSRTKFSRNPQSSGPASGAVTQ
jgi:hypothetical protein